MGYKVQFDDGQMVEFDSAPTQADIDEAHAHLTGTKIAGPAKLPMPLDIAGGIAETATTGVADAFGGLGAQVAGAVKGMITPGMTASQGRDEMANAYGNSTVAKELAPQTETGKWLAEKIGKAIEGIKEDFGALGAGEGPNADPNAPEWAKTGRRMFAAGMSTLPEATMMIPALPHEASGIGKFAEKAKQKKGLDTKAYTDSVAAEPVKPLDLNLTEGPETGAKPLYADERGVVTPALPDEALQAAKARQQGMEEVRSGPGRETIPPSEGERPLYVDPQGQAFRGDPAEETARLALEKQTEAADNALTHNETPMTEEPLGLLRKDSYDAANQGPNLERQYSQPRELDPSVVDNHPFVKAAEARVEKQQQVVTKLILQAEEGKAQTAELARAVADLERLKQSADTTRENIQKGVGEGQKPAPFNFKRQGGGVNLAVFDEGFHKVKEFGDYTLELMGRQWGPEVRIYDKEGKDVGGLSTSAIYGKSGSDRNLAADFVKILTPHQKQGLAEAAYRFLAETGNDIQKSSTQLQPGREMWKRFEEKGLAKNGVIPAIKTTIKSPGNKQRGALLIDPEQGDKAKWLSEHPNLKLNVVPDKYTPEKAIEIASKQPDVKQNFLQKANNYLTKGGLYQSLKTNNVVVKYVQEKLHAADSEARGDIQNYVHDKLGPASRALSKQELTDIWNIVDLHDKLQKPVDVNLLREQGASEKQIAYVQAHREVMDYAFDKLNEARKAAGLEPVSKRTAYAAMKSTGDFRRLVYKLDEAGEKHVVGVIGSDFRPKLDSLVKKMEEQGYTVGEEHYAGGLPRQRGSAQMAITQALDVFAKDDPRIADFMKVLEELGRKEAYDYLNTKRHTMNKKGVFGMEGRKDWIDAHQNAKEGVQAQLQYAEAAIKWGHLSKAVEQINPVLSSDKINMPNAKKWGEDYVKNALGFNPSEMGSSIEKGIAAGFGATGVGYSNIRTGFAVAKQTVNTLLLSLDPGFWLTNVVQPFQSLPGMKAYLASKGMSSSFDLGTGYAYMGKAALSDWHRRFGGMTDLEKGAFDYAKKYHVYGSDLVEHSNKATKDTGYWVDKVGNSVAGKVESGTRQLMYMTFVHMLDENGLSVKNGLYETAHNLTDMSMNNYSPLERPRIYNSLGPIGDMAANLSSYKHNEFSRLALFARQIAEEKSARPLLTQIAATVAYAGITGMVAFNEADWLFKQITKFAGNPTSLTEQVIKMSENIGEKLGAKDEGKYALSHGGFSLLGIDMSKRLGINDALPNSLGEAAFPGGSKLVDVAKAGANAVWNPSEMNAKRFAHEIVPRPVAGMMDRAWFSKDRNGQEMAANRNNLKGQVLRTDADKTAKLMGFTGLHESVQKDKLFQADWVKQAYADKRVSSVETIRDLMYTLKPGQDLNSIPAAREAIQKYIQNEGDPKSLVSDISKLAREQRLTGLEAEQLHSAMSQSITNLRQAQRLQKAFK